MLMNFDTFLDDIRAAHIPGTLPTLNLPMKGYPFIRVAAFFSDVILVLNFHNHKGKITKLLPYHSFFGGHPPPLPKKNWAPFSGMPHKKMQDHQDLHLAAFS